MKDPYAILGIQKNASLHEAKSAYKKLVKLYHPDKATSEAEREKNNSKVYQDRNGFKMV